MKGCNISSINLMKVVGELVKPKGMTNHSKKPSLDLKVVFQTSVCSIGTWWWPDFRSFFLKNLAPLSWSMRSSIKGIWYRFQTLILLRALQLIQSLHVPYFFCKSMIRLPQGEEVGWMGPFWSNYSI